MSSIERFISTKAYELKRKQMRAKGKKEKYQGEIGMSFSTKPNLPTKKPQIVAFSVGQVANHPKERVSKRRVQAQQVRIKKIIGIGLIAIGVLLLLTRCFGNTNEEVDQEVANNISISVGNDEKNMQTKELIQVSYQEILQDFTSEKDIIEELFNISLKHKQEYAHTFAVWALQRFTGISDKEAVRNLNRKGIGEELTEFGLYEDSKVFFEQFIYDIKNFPIQDVSDYVYENGWKQEREYKGKRKHYGIDIMAMTNKDIPIISMSNGVVEQVGWNEIGGYRVGIRSDGGAYFYYAHMKEKPGHIKKGDYITAGTYIGTMGNTGYGIEGTSGKFPTHLHLGIAIATGDNKEFWINPYGILRFLEDNK